ncbi:TPA: DNA-binding response regulator, partial [Staphylococcus aureus]|nr:DNA-binding response regulator [Staphylococcus aureus]
MQILLVEDDNTLFQELKKELEQWNFNVAGIEDFGKVMDTFESFNPEIV